ncbi:hypothetical protein HMPREF1051_0738 [Neisseria sicca VK64]|uniref:Uncharacterized protein n=1 Tax=Neisseria sicca VK64 TaxID=1095748 RepID=I2NQM0_NEISI|nr:hypothetical protein HMPREF1051_0738 [Neisseria sicca VK64]
MVDPHHQRFFKFKTAVRVQTDGNQHRQRQKYHTGYERRAAETDMKIVHKSNKNRDLEKFSC